MSSLRALLLILAAAGAFTPLAAHAWWNCAWPARVALDVSAPAAGTNVVVETALSAAALPGFPWSGTDASIRVVAADDATVLPHWSEPRPGSVQRLGLWFRVPAIGPTPRRVYVYYGNAAATSTATTAIFSEPGVRLLTRRLAGPRHLSLAEFYSQYDGAGGGTGYGCRVLPDYVNRSNLTVFGAGTNVHYGAMFFLDVPAGGAWQLRLGPDYGYGGALYVNGQTVQARWGTDIWWDGDFGNASRLLAGSATLNAGRNFVVTYGSEECCEGLHSLQVRGPSGPWRDLRTGVTQFALVAPSCPVAGQSVVRVAESGRLEVRALSSGAVVDPVSGAALPKSIPGARTRYSVRVTDAGSGWLVDPDSMRVVVPVPANTRLYVGDLGAPGSGPVRFVDGSPASGLTFAYAGLGAAADDVAFSSDGGASWGYVPVPGADGTDPAVTHVRVNPKGRPVCTGTGPGRQFDLEIDVVVR